eukprot:TRINITY_DN6198_c0_g1_i1.p1 TRINITY_DN6198_c0_g1~~TRINITY_DN6198_c0_g1_i1.p1  ORF type:complete len:465 (+),score=103.02 TRINITY_DN6198_c0_g1_i1:95-1489(+)
MAEEKKAEEKKAAPQRKDESYAKVHKKSEDFSGIVDRRLPELKDLATTNIDQAVEQLLALEKQTRLGEDASSTSRVVEAIVDAFAARRDYKQLNAHLLLLSKRRGQLKQAVTRMVQRAMTVLDQMDEPTKLETIDTLRLICEGKIHVELERARLTRLLASIQENKGQVDKAADTLQTVQVETYGSMENREKFDFILEQMRLCMAKGDWIRTEILSKKIANKALNDEQLQDLRLRFYAAMSQFYQHERRYLDLCRCFLEVAKTPKVQADETLWKSALSSACVYIALAPFDNEQSDIMNRIAIDKKLEQLPQFKQLLKLFLTQELAQWPRFLEQYRPVLSSDAFFVGEVGEKTWTDLQKRVSEHNVRVVARYYSRITMTRLAELLNVDTTQSERFLCDMVSSHGVYAKIDRPSGIVVFARPKDCNDVLNDWSHNVGKLLTLVEDTCHMINKERMVHQTKVAAAARG